MKSLRNLKTSERITTYFSLFNLLSLIVLLVSINVIYFFIWYSDIESKSLYDMNVNYDSYTDGMSENNKDAFKSYILAKDTIITDHSGEMICSDGVSQKLHGNEDELTSLMNSYFYSIDGKTYFVFTNVYDDIGAVSILHDTTDYFNSQMIIVKLSLIIISFFIILNYFVGKFIAKIALKDLKDITQKAFEFDLDCDFHSINIDGPKDDEIKILAQALNKSFKRIKYHAETQQQFITDVSHEFKTPLMIMNSQVDLYKKSLEKGKKVEINDFLSGFKLNIKKLNKLLETLFFLSRVQDNSIDFEKQRINLYNYISELSISLQAGYINKKITIDININKEINLEVEKGTFGILIENLLTNAIKFNGKEVKIEINYSNNILEVEDNGNGIEEDKLSNIWNKFSRIDNKIEGFGVGLFLVKRISNIYGWKIEVESEIDEGTKFIIKM